MQEDDKRCCTSAQHCTASDCADRHRDGGHPVTPGGAAREVESSANDTSPGLDGQPSSGNANVSRTKCVSPTNTFGFRMATQHVSDTTALQVNQHLTLLSMELVADSRGQKQSDPARDPILSIFCALHDDTEPTVRAVSRVMLTYTTPGQAAPARALLGMRGVRVLEFRCERTLIEGFVELVRTEDPDIVVGYEIQLSSWGYLLQRGEALGYDLAVLLSRTPTATAAAAAATGGGAENNYAATHTSEFRLVGRIILNLWRLMRHEVALTSYSFENVMYHILHRRVPAYSQQQLRAWYMDTRAPLRWRVCKHLLFRAVASLQLMYEINFIERTSEFARLFGILFFEVISRGSQFRVEAIMLRIAHPKNFVMLSPSKDQVRNQRAPEALPLILEPESKFYTSPVLVLDFQSLYPSMMIAYNICFSTCLGKVTAAPMTTKPKGWGIFFGQM